MLMLWKIVPVLQLVKPLKVIIQRIPLRVMGLAMCSKSGIALETKNGMPILRALPTYDFRGNGFWGVRVANDIVIWAEGTGDIEVRACVDGAKREGVSIKKALYVLELKNLLSTRQLTSNRIVEENNCQMRHQSKNGRIMMTDLLKLDNSTKQIQRL
ncbi:unnamed protein product [Sphagnum troendelagicum]|uniref:Uncharacterized protein n=1 Tax=Sphagnum troendelagicum TaxID=128251 RepID=A0ABP0TP08_9BRYO